MRDYLEEVLEEETEDREELRPRRAVVRGRRRGQAEDREKEEEAEEGRAEAGFPAMPFLAGAEERPVRWPEKREGTVPAADRPAALSFDAGESLLRKETQREGLEDGAAKESVPSPALPAEWRAAVRREDGTGPVRRTWEPSSEPGQAAEGESEDVTELSAGGRIAAALSVLLRRMRTFATRTTEAARNRKDPEDDSGAVRRDAAGTITEPEPSRLSGSLPAYEGEARSAGFAGAEEEAVVTEEPAEADGSARYAGTGDIIPEDLSPARDGRLPSPEGGGREETAALLLQGISRAGRIAGTARGSRPSSPPEDGREEAAAVLLRSISRAARVAGTGRGGGGTALVTLADADSPAREPDVEALDLAVQRDARRYDGGFQLF